MDNKTATKKEIKPISYGFISGGKIYFKVKCDFLNEFSYYNTLGKDLIDFVWFNEKLARDIFEMVFDYYPILRHKKDDYWFIAAGLIDSAEKFLNLNSYFSMYLLGFIDFLLTSNIDSRLLSNVAVEEFLRYGYLVESETNQIFDLDKHELIDVFLYSMKERQALVSITLDKVLKEKDSSTASALARFYEYENNDELFRENWSSHFESFFGKRAESTTGIVQLTVLNRIDDMMRYELVQMLVRNVKYKYCQNCKKLFIPSGRSDSLYCDRVMQGEEKACKEIGAQIAAKKKLENNDELKIYRLAYQRLKKRVEFEYMSAEEFDKWNAEALPMRNECTAGKLSFDEFKAWIDKSSRQNRNS